MAPVYPFPSLEPARAAHARGAHDEVVALVSAFLAKAGPGARTVPACEALSLLVRALHALGRFSEALTRGEEALAGWRALADHRQVSDTLSMQAYALTETGQHARALEHAELAFQIVQTLGLPAEALQLLILLGSLHSRLLAFDSAEALLMQAMSRARDRNDRDLIAQATNALLAVQVQAHGAHSAAGDAERAAAVAARMQPVAQRLLNHAAGEAHAFRRAVQTINACNALLLLGLAERALAGLEEALALCRQHGFELVRMRGLGRLAQAHIQLGSASAAEQALDEFQTALNQVPHAMAATDLAQLQAQLQRLRTGAGPAAIQQAGEAVVGASRAQLAAETRAAVADADGAASRWTEAMSRIEAREVPSAGRTAATPSTAQDGLKAVVIQPSTASTPGGSP